MSDPHLGPTEDEPARTPEGQTATLDDAYAALGRAREAGDPADLLAVLRRFPQFAEDLREALEAEQLFGLVDRPLDPMRLIPESRLEDRYELLGTLGKGSYGEVLRARDRVLNRTVAIKLFSRGLAELPAVVRFLVEPQIAGQLTGPGVPAIHDLGKTPEGRPFIVMKLIEGETLSDVLKRSPRPDTTRLIDVFRQVCVTVASAHRRSGVLHRDLKPDNIMVDEFSVQVMDWGMGRVLAGDERPHAAGGGELFATQAGQRLGTPLYMSPEQCRGQIELVGPASDVFGLGAVLCEILTDAPPYLVEGRDPRKVLEEIENGTVDEAYSRLDRSGADPALIALARRCLDPDSRKRPKDAGEVADAVTAYQEGFERRWRWARAAGLYGGATAVLIVGLLGLGWWAMTTREARRIEDAARETRERDALDARHEQARRSMDDAESLVRKGRVADARDPLGRAFGLIGAEEGPLKDRADGLGRACDFAAEVEEIRQGEGNGAGRSYADAFRSLGLDLSAPGAAERLRVSPVREQALAALDHWVLLDVAPGTRQRLRELAWAASDSDWGRRFRDPETWKRPGAASLLAEETFPRDRSPAEIEALARAMASGGDALPLLRRGLSAHPQDFWLNLLLARSLAGTSTASAVEFARVASTLRPESKAAREELGARLLDADRPAEAADELRRVVGPGGSERSRELLVRALMRQREWRAAENVCAEAGYQERFRRLREEVRRAAGGS